MSVPEVREVCEAFRPLAIGKFQKLGYCFVDVASLVTVWTGREMTKNRVKKSRLGRKC